MRSRVRPFAVAQARVLALAHARVLAVAQARVLVLFLVLVLATFAALVTLASPARAATVTVDGSFLTIAAAPGEANRLTVIAGPPPPAAAASFTVTDSGSPLTAVSGCTQTDAGVTCVTPVDAAIDVFAGDRDDSVTIGASGGVFVDGGSGSDVIEVANAAGDSVWCSGGRDSVTADVLDSLDLGCERVDYGPAGSVGRLRWLAGGGGRVPVPGQSWALVDRRILADVLYLIRGYHVRITEGFGTVGHTNFGEHPLALAVDIEPGAGGSWDDVSRLARWAEPRQNRPRPPFRFVGWNGDFNHGHPSVCKRRLGCAPHLHLSWAHSPTPPLRLARSVRVFEVRPAAP
jgi:hypothetical protein